MWPAVKTENLGTPGWPGGTAAGTGTTDSSEKMPTATATAARRYGDYRYPMASAGWHGTQARWPAGGRAGPSTKKEWALRAFFCGIFCAKIL